MSRKSWLLLLISWVAASSFTRALAQPVVSAVVNAASFGPSLSPGCWAAIFGSELAPSLAAAEVVPLPTTLANVSVTVGGVAAPLLFVSPGQINALIPFEVTSTLVPVVVRSPDGQSTPHNIRLGASAPAIFSRDATGTGRGHVFDASFRPIETLGNEEHLIFYAAGLGATDPPGSTDSGGVFSEPLNRIIIPIEVYVGEQKAEVEFAGLAPGFPGIYQVNIKTPEGISTERLYIRSGGWQSNQVDVGISQGGNVANVAGSIMGLYPSTDPNSPPFIPPPTNPEGFSVMLQAAAFTVSFDILPAAKPFTVAAVGEAGSSVILIDPAKGTYEATVGVPSVVARVGDFSDAADMGTVWDFYTCLGGICQPTVGNIIPRSRLDPAAVMAVNLLPSPSVYSPGSANGLFNVSGTAQAGSRFVVDGENNSSLSRFGGYLRIGYGFPTTRTTTFRLYVDGVLVASKDASYSVYHE